MALFTKTKAAISPPPSKAAAAGSTFNNYNGPSGNAMIGEYYTYNEGVLFGQAMSVPTIARAQQLISSVIASMKLKMYTEMWNGEEMEQIPLAPRSWLRRIDRVNTNNHILSWTVSDLLMFGRAFWYVTERTADGYPAAFTRLPAAMVTTRDQSGLPAGVWFAPSKSVYFNGGHINPDDLVQFLNGQPGIVFSSSKAIATSIKLEDARFRNASSAIPAGVLQVQAGSEPLSSSELADLAASFNAARATNQTAALSPEVHYIETATSPDKMLLVDSAEFQALEMSRVTGVPAYLLNLSMNSYNYTNSISARQDLWTFGCKQIAECITQTLSANNILPNNTCVEFDIDDFIDGDLMEKEEMEEMPQPPRSNGVPYSS
jgi:hypothetical protein